MSRDDKDALFLIVFLICFAALVVFLSIIEQEIGVVADKACVSAGYAYGVVQSWGVAKCYNTLPSLVEFDPLQFLRTETSK